MALSRRRGRRQTNVWPGFVDALSSLLMLVVFVLLVFVFAQALLARIVSGQESELDVLHERVAQLTELLGLEREDSERLRARVAALKGERAGLEDRIAGLERRRVDLQGRVGALVNAMEAVHRGFAGEYRRRLAAEAVNARQAASLDQERRLSAETRAQVALLNERIAALKAQLEEIARALAVARTREAAKDSHIQELTKRLNIELARRVNRLEQYRSEFFGRLREALGNDPAVRVVGDRFLFQAELLFTSGSAELGAEGRKRLVQLARTLKAVARRIPADLPWLLRVDGHTDRRPIHNARFPSNWELSAARAVAVVRFLAAQGIPPERLAAAGFGEYHPLDPADTAAAYRRNRRIEIKLTAR